MLHVGCGDAGCGDDAAPEPDADTPGPLTPEDGGTATHCRGPLDCDRGDECTDAGVCKHVAALRISTRSLPNAVVATPYSVTLEVSGGAQPYSYALMESYLTPELAWLRMDPVTGELYGTPPEVLGGQSGLGVNVKDQSRQLATKSYKLGVIGCEEGDEVVCFRALEDGCGQGTGTCEDGEPGDECSDLHPSQDEMRCGPSCAPCDETKANRCDEGRCLCGTEPACTGEAICCGDGEDATCADPMSDAKHCGACDNACDAGKGEHSRAVCRNGGCQLPACDEGWGRCDMMQPEDCLTDVSADVENCGACGNGCDVPDSADACVDGLCICGDDGHPCVAEETCCEGMGCADLDAGKRVEGGIAFCGSCTADLCPDPLHNGVATCASGDCGAECATSTTATWADCGVAPGSVPLDCTVNLLTDETNCGECGTVCPNATSGPGTGVGVCAYGECEVECSPGLMQCEIGTGVPPSCFDLDVDADHCGGCMRSCSGNNVERECVEGDCVGDCDPGYEDCNERKDTDGCEIHTTDDDLNCGACDVSCLARHQQAGCTDGLCTGSCALGYEDCDMSLASNGCEIDTEGDAQNCGACGISCSDDMHVEGDTCTTGGCVGSCVAGYADCNSDLYTDGCETHTDGDADNCGACANQSSSAACSKNHVAPACMGGTCGGTCDWEDPGTGSPVPRWDNCNMDMRTDGCETDLWNDPAHCGSCTLACPDSYWCAVSDGIPTCYPACFPCCGASVAGVSTEGWSYLAPLPFALFALSRRTRKRLV